MKRIFCKNELMFALLWIGIYCLGMSSLDEVSRRIGIDSSVSALFALAISLFLFLWIKTNGSSGYFGLCPPTVPAKSVWFYIPLALITTQNLWGGFELRYNVTETVCFVVKMLCVGFLEELIFRGFLFKALARTNVKTAILVSSVSFGLGHLLNLINGSGMGLAENLAQVFFAVLIGFLYVILFHRGGSLWPCIISHGVFNSLSAFSASSRSVVLLVLLCVLVVVYSLILLKTLPVSVSIMGETR